MIEMDNFRYWIAVGLTLLSIMASSGLSLSPTNSPIPKAVLERALSRRMRVTGGMVVKPGSQKGRIAFINSQNKFPQQSIDDIARQLAALSRFDIVSVSNDLGADGTNTMKTANAEVAVIMVADSSTPLMLLAPEDGWAMVNVAKVPVGEKFKAGCCKELLRTFAMLCGGGLSQISGNVLSEPDLRDTYSLENTLPKDVTYRMAKYLKSRGITAASMATYKAACEQGWAPAPTNDVQKAIWEKAKSDKERGPTNPIRIEATKK